jgi:ribosome biogenesis ATPase
MNNFLASMYNSNSTANGTLEGDADEDIKHQKQQQHPPNHPLAKPSTVHPLPPPSTTTTTTTKPKRTDGATATAAPTPLEQRQKRQRTGGGAGGASRLGNNSSSSSSALVNPSPVRYSDLGGVEAVLEDIKELIEYPLKHPEVYTWLGVEPPRGVLLHGPPGCGKTALANAIANECGVPFLKVSAPEVVSGMSGESEAKVRQLFQEAAALAPCIVFIDEIDAIAPKRETAQREMERRIVAQMLTCLDDLSSSTVASATDSTTTTTTTTDGSIIHPPLGKHVVVIGATNRPDALDAALRRAGRFDREISLGIPSEAAREAIIRVLARRLRLAGDFDFVTVAKRTPGFVGADLAALMKEAAALAVQRIFKTLNDDAAAAAAYDNDNNSMKNVESDNAMTSSEQDRDDGGEVEDGNPQQPQLPLRSRMGQGPLTPTELSGLAITAADFDGAIKKVQPSVRREGFATTPGITWADVGSLTDVREELTFSITQPIARPEIFEAMGLAAATGVLLFGPPGCGKTLVAKAAAAESGANFISIKGPELLNKYVGESERAVRQLFSRARAASPCVLFFDELDALAPRRGGMGPGGGSSDGSASAERLVNQLLTEMDGIDGRAGVFVVAATNRPDMIDPALLRPGRLDKILYVPLPPPDGRVSILKTLTRGTPLVEGAEADLESLGMSDKLSGFSGADLAALVREACVMAIKERMARGEVMVGEGGGDMVARPPKVTMQHFEDALKGVQPSVSRRDHKMYEILRKKLRSSRARLEPAAAVVTDGNGIDEGEGGDGMQTEGEGGTGDEAPMEA